MCLFNDKNIILCEREMRINMINKEIPVLTMDRFQKLNDFYCICLGAWDLLETLIIIIKNSILKTGFSSH